MSKRNSPTRPCNGATYATRHCWRVRLFHTLDRLGISISVFFTITAIIVGYLTGMGAVLFIWMIGAMEKGFEWMRSVPLGGLPWGGVLIPAIGGLIAGPLIYYFAQEAKGHGVPEVMQALLLNGGRIRPQVVVIKAAASAACIGSGGSAGREGPIVQIGAALGSVIGQVLHFSERLIRNLVACGAAAGIAATFNAPIAGVIFSLEVILGGEFTSTYFATVVISAVTASIVSRHYLGESPAFLVPSYGIRHPGELLLYFLLGLLAAIVGWLFVTTLYAAEDLAEKKLTFISDAWKPALGGLLLGVLGYWMPQSLGTGFTSIELALAGRLSLGLMAALVFAKMIATDITLGSGNSGGVFAPGLFMGAMLGGAFGHVVHAILPSYMLGPVGAYALVGMAAVFAGAAHAPLTAMLIVFEMSGDYRLILPLMLATGVSTVVSRALRRDSIYTLKLTRRGINWEGGRDVDVLQHVKVEEVMTTDVDTVPESTTLEELEALFDATRHHGFPVLDDEGRLVGMVALEDLARAKERWPQEWREHTVGEIASRELVVAYPDETMADALRRLGLYDVSRLPVVSRMDHHQLLGVLRRADIIRAYRRAMVNRIDAQHSLSKARLHALGGSSVLEFDLYPTSPVVGKRVQEVKWPRECLVVAVKRDNEVVVAHGDTPLAAGDRLIIYGDAGCAPLLEKLLHGEEQVKEGEAEAA